MPYSQIKKFDGMMFWTNRNLICGTVELVKSGAVSKVRKVDELKDKTSIISIPFL